MLGQSLALSFLVVVIGALTRNDDQGSSDQGRNGWLADLRQPYVGDTWAVSGQLREQQTMERARSVRRSA